jgi:hypothetical protein
MMGLSDAWSFELERALMRELVEAYKAVNGTHFKFRLRLPSFVLGDHRSFLGRWHRDTATLEISRALVMERPWVETLEVLKHEMAHQYVYEALQIADESPHGPTFQKVCEQLGIDGRAAGLPNAEGQVPGIVDRIVKLLALASSDNQHEAEAAMLAAQRLMLKYNVEAVQSGTTQPYRFVHLGEPTGRVFESDRVLAMILAKHFFVEVIWVSVYRPREKKRGSVLEVCGSPENRSMAEYVHAFLRRTADALWADYRRRSGLSSNRDRQRYLSGVMAGFADKLAEQAKGAKQAGLVWVKDGELGGYMRRRYPYVRNVRHSGNVRDEAFASGREDGKKIVLHKPVASSASSHGRLLGPKAPT